MYSSLNTHDACNNNFFFFSQHHHHHHLRRFFEASSQNSQIWRTKGPLPTECSSSIIQFEEVNEWKKGCFGQWKWSEIRICRTVGIKKNVMEKRSLRGEHDISTIWGPANKGVNGKWRKKEWIPQLQTTNDRNFNWSLPFLSPSAIDVSWRIIPVAAFSYFCF